MMKKWLANGNFPFPRRFHKHVYSRRDNYMGNIHCWHLPSGLFCQQEVSHKGQALNYEFLRDAKLNSYVLATTHQIFGVRYYVNKTVPHISKCCANETREERLLRFFPNCLKQTNGNRVFLQIVDENCLSFREAWKFLSSQQTRPKICILVSFQELVYCMAVRLSHNSLVRDVVEHISDSTVSPISRVLLMRLAAVYMN